MRCASVALAPSPATAPPTPEAIGTTGNYGRARHDRPGGRSLAPSSASLEVSRPYSTRRPWRSQNVFPRRPASGTCSPLARPVNGAARIDWTHWGGSFGGVSSRRLDATPIVIRPSCASAIGETGIDTLAEGPAISSDAVWIVLSGRVMHRRGLFSSRGVPLRVDLLREPPGAFRGLAKSVAGSHCTQSFSGLFHGLAERWSDVPPS